MNVIDGRALTLDHAKKALECADRVTDAASPRWLTWRCCRADGWLVLLRNYVLALAAPDSSFIAHPIHLFEPNKL